ncbi:unnamed protein product [Boreogadus saida]
MAEADPDLMDPWASERSALAEQQGSAATSARRERLSAAGLGNAEAPRTRDRSASRLAEPRPGVEGPPDKGPASVKNNSIDCT